MDTSKIFVAVIIVLSILVWGGFFLIAKTNIKNEKSYTIEQDIKEPEKELKEEEIVKKVPLYYNIDNPNVIYILNDEGKFEEVINLNK